MEACKGSVYEELKKRRLPELLVLQEGKRVEGPRDWLLRREEILELYRSEVYGSTGLDAGQITWRVEQVNEKALADKAVYQRIQVSYASARGSFEFPFHLTLPKGVKKVPVFVYLSFEESMAGVCLPLEEIVDQGYGVAALYYQDIALDVPEYKGEKLSALVPAEERSGCGTIALWAFGASRVADCLLQMEQVDAERLAVVGHSRLGKTALWCGAVDERFAMVISNDSGAGGASLFRGTVKETLKELCRPQIHFWFREKFLTYADREEEIPLDQHFLLALVAPRHLYISSAAEDEWADCVSEFLAAAAASEVYELLGEKGLVENGIFNGDEIRSGGKFSPEKTICGQALSYPAAGTVWHQGKIGYHLRKGNHFLSRYDWNQMIAYREQHHC